MKRGNRHFGLDFIRALAILSVVYGHSIFILKNIFPEASSFPYLRGVDVFFVLSGFLIGTRFLQQAEKPEGINQKYALNFLRHAAFRILPMYFLFLAINVFVSVYVLNYDLTIKKLLSCLFLVQNVFSPHVGFFWESWSLPITVWFYVILTFSMLFIYRRRHQTKQFKNNIKILLVVMLLLPVFVRLYIHFYHSLDYFWWDVKIRKFLPARIDSPFYGLAMAWLRFYYPAFFKKLTFPGLIVGIVLYLWYYLYTPEPGSIGKDLIYLVTSPVTYILAMPAIMRLKRASKIIAVPFTQISILSYAIYLTNLLIAILFKHYFEITPQNASIYYLAYWFIVIFSSWSVYNYYEKQVRTVFDKWNRSGIRFRQR